MASKKSSSRIPHYGGQALIEGILMRGKKYVVAAFRQPDMKIRVEFEELQGIYKTKMSSIPFLRGLVILWDSLSLGMKYLTLSANIQTGEEEKIEGPALFLTLGFSLVLAVGLFFILPTFIAELISRFFNLGYLSLNILEGFIRLLILVLYIWLIGRSKEISRVFAYHGAEHKTINAYENNEKISLSNIMDYPLEHPRCGTSFLLTLVVFSILIFALLGPLPFGLRIATRILLIPLIAMIAYEIIRFMGDHIEHPLIRILTLPNLFLQKLTTREPTQEMVEISISAFNKLIQLENEA